MATPTKIGTEFLVNTTTTGTQRDANVTALTNGKFVVVWRDSSLSGGDTSGAAVRGQLFNADGSKSGAEFLANTATASDQDEACVTALTGGGFVVQWTDYSTGNADVRGQIFSSTAVKVGSEFVLNTTTAGTQEYHAGTALAGGGWVSAWTNQNALDGDPSSSIRAQIFDAAGTKLGAEFRVNTTVAGAQDLTALGTLSGGGFVAAWRDQSLSGGDTIGDAVRAQIYDATGTKVGGEILVNSATIGSQNFPTVAGLSNGNFVVAFNDVTPRTVHARLFTATGTAIGSDFVVNTAGSALVGSGAVVSPNIASLSDGTFVITYFTNYDGIPNDDTSSYAVRGQLFNADGSKSGTEFLVNTTTTNAQYYPTVAALSGGKFVVAFQDDSANAGDIRAQIMGPPPQAPVAINDTASTTTVLGVAAVQDESTNADLTLVSNPFTYVGAAEPAPGDGQYRYSSQNGASYVWTPGLTGTYLVESSWATYPDHTTDADYSFDVDGYGGGVAAVASLQNINQRLQADQVTVGSNSAWSGFAVVGTYTLNSGSQFRVTDTSSTGALIAGAWRFTPVNDYNAAGNVLTNDTDVDTDSALFVVTSFRTGGTEGAGTAGVVGTALVGAHGTLTLNANGTYTYVGNAADAAILALNVGGTVTDSFNYTMSDGSLSDSAVLTITINGVNDAPAITSNGAGASAALSIVENIAAVTTVTATDVDSATLTYSIVGGADAAKFTIDPATGVLTFIAAPDFENPTDVGANNIYDVKIKVVDASGGIDIQALAVTVTNAGNTGGPGNDNLESGPGADTLSGGAGDDTFYATGADLVAGETIDGGADTDTLRIDGGGTVSLAGVTLTSVERITLTNPAGTRLVVADAAQAALVFSAAGAADTVAISSFGFWGDFSTLSNLKALHTAGVENVEWNEGGATNIARKVGGNTVITSTETAGAEWKTGVLIFGANDKIASWVVEFDDGRVRTTAFTDGKPSSETTTDPLNAQPWSSITREWDANGVLSQEVIAYETGITQTQNLVDGVRTEYSLVDAGNTAAWKSLSYLYNPAGQLTAFETIADNDIEQVTEYVGGVRTTHTTTDMGNIATFHQEVQTFDAAGTSLIQRDVELDPVTGQVGDTFRETYANGQLQKYEYYDLDNSDAITSVVDIYQAGVLQTHAIDYDTGPTWVFGNAADQTLTSTSADEYLWGRGGYDVFAFAPGNGSDRIMDFEEGVDKIDLTAYGIHSKADIDPSAITEPYGHLTIDLGGGNSLKIIGFSIAQFSDADFV